MGAAFLFGLAVVAAFIGVVFLLVGFCLLLDLPGDDYEPPDPGWPM